MTEEDAKELVFSARLKLIVFSGLLSNLYLGFSLHPESSRLLFGAMPRDNLK